MLDRALALAQQCCHHLHVNLCPGCIVEAAGGWYQGVREGISVDTELRTDPPRFPWLWLVPALIVTAATVVSHNPAGQVTSVPW